AALESALPRAVGALKAGEISAAQALAELDVLDVEDRPLVQAGAAARACVRTRQVGGEQVQGAALRVGQVTLEGARTAQDRIGFDGCARACVADCRCSARATARRGRDPGAAPTAVRARGLDALGFVRVALARIGRTRVFAGRPPQRSESEERGDGNADLH